MQWHVGDLTVAWCSIQGDPGDLFYIIKEGEAVVYQDTPRGVRLVNRLFKSDFFGEQALMRREPRMASVEAVSQRLVCLALRRDVFVNLLGDLHEIMNREKSPQVCSCISSVLTLSSVSILLLYNPMSSSRKVRK